MPTPQPAYSTQRAFVVQIHGEADLAQGEVWGYETAALSLNVSGFNRVPRGERHVNLSQKGVSMIRPRSKTKTFMTRSHVFRAILMGTLALLLAIPAAMAQENKPNILVIWGDDIGVHNISAYNHGIMGYQTPNMGIHFRRDTVLPQ